MGGWSAGTPYAPAERPTRRARMANPAAPHRERDPEQARSSTCGSLTSRTGRVTWRRVPLRRAFRARPSSRRPHRERRPAAAGVPARAPVVRRRLADRRARAAAAGPDRRRRGRAPERAAARPVGLALAPAPWSVWPSWSISARRDQQRAEAALTEGLGADYVEQLDALPTPADLRSRGARWSTRSAPAQRPRRRRRARHRLRPGRRPQPARRLPRPPGRVRGRPGAAAGARRRPGSSAARTSRASR